MDALQRDFFFFFIANHTYFGSNSRKVELIENKRILKNPGHFGMKFMDGSSIWNSTISYDFFHSQHFEAITLQSGSVYKAH